MLSRIAESLFWIGRYVERADSTARIVDVHVQRLLEDSWLDEEQSCVALLSVMGVAPGGDPADDGHRHPPMNRERLLDLLAFDPRSPSSIAAALAAARENARRARETVSSEMWEAINTTYFGMPARSRSTSTNRFCTWVRERVATVTGIADTTMSRDTGYRFLLLGRSLERADMTARLLSTVALPSGPAWSTMLRSCGAYEAFLRTYSSGRSGARTDAQAAEFLLLDRVFPRSIVFSLRVAEDCLLELTPTRRRAGFGDDALRVLAQARANLEFRRLGELLGDLPIEMDRVQFACSTASARVSSRYFPATSGLAWTAHA